MQILNFILFVIKQSILIYFKSNRTIRHELVSYNASENVTSLNDVSLGFARRTASATVKRETLYPHHDRC